MASGIVNNSDRLRGCSVLPCADVTLSSPLSPRVYFGAFVTTTTINYHGPAQWQAVQINRALDKCALRSTALHCRCMAGVVSRRLTIV